MAVTRGEGPESLKARCSNEEAEGMVVVLMFF